MKKSLTVGIISLFILSAIAPMSLGLDVKTDVVRESVSTSSYVEPMEHIWSMYKNDSRNTGCSIYNTSDNPGHEKWKYFVDRSLIGGVAIDKEGIIYVASSSNYDGLHAVYPNGTRKWKVSLDGYENQNPAIAPDGSIIVGTSRYLYSIYPNGTIKWKFSINSNFNCETVVDSNGIIYTATSDGIVYAIYANGTLKWEFYAADFIWYIALDEDENIYFGGPYSNSLFCLYPDGTLKWCYEFYYDMIGAPVIDDNGIIYAGFVHWLVALYPDGTEKWIVDFLENDWYGYPSIAPDGTIILSGAGDYVTALDPEDCSVIWQYLVDYRTDDFTTASISADGFIYFGYKGYENDKGYLCCLYPNGTLKWKTRLTTDYLPFNSVNIYCNPAIGADGTVYVTSWFIRSGSNYTNIGYIHAFEFADVIVDRCHPGPID